jgi:hypothetical protein
VYSLGGKEGRSGGVGEWGREGVREREILISNPKSKTCTELVEVSKI